MNSKTIQSLQYFIGKVCSVFTVSSNRNSLSEEHAREYFVARITSVDTDGIWGTHPSSHMASFFPLSYVVSIVEEMELDPKNPKHLALIEKMENQKTVNEPQVASNKQFVDVKNLEILAKQTKQNYERNIIP